MMRELLLAYLFGQLEADQRERVERALADDPRWQEELRRLRMCLGKEPLPTEEVVEPPPDLVERTCSRVLSHAGPAAHLLEPWESQPADEAEAFLKESNGAPALPLDAETRYSRGDLTVAIGLSVVAAMLLFPALHDSQILARRTACQNNLREMYLGLSTFASVNGGMIPHVPAEGKEAFAGIYSVLLGEREFVDRQELPRLLRCPGATSADEWKGDALVLQLWIPTRAQLRRAPDEVVAALQRQLGGDYAYRLGYLDKTGRYHSWLLDHSSRSAILADAPSLHMRSFRSTNHGGRGQNVLMADGHVAFLFGDAELAGGDALYTNTAGYRAAAFGPVDSVLVPSEQGPALNLIRSIFGWGSLPQ